MDDDEERVCKIVTVGDDCSGKTDMLVSYCRGSTHAYRPSEFDSYNVPATIDGVFLYLSLWDAPESAAYDSIRPLAYRDSLVFVACFSIYHPESLQNVEKRWVPEILKSNPDVPIVLVGTDFIADSAEGAAERIKHKVSAQAIESVLNNTGAVKYVHVSLLGSLDAVFQEAARAAFARYRQTPAGTQDEKCIIS